MLRALRTASELAKILVPDDEHSGALGHARPNRGAVFMGEVGSVLPRHGQRPSKADGVPNQGAVPIASATVVMLRDAPAAPFQPFRDGVAAFRKSMQQNMGGCSCVLQSIVMAKGNSKALRQRG
nr:hypothetical protein [Altericroceibacterium xinjiangense]